MLLLNTQYPGRANAPNSAYPAGSCVNETGVGTGTPLDAAWANDVLGALQAVLSAAGITPNGVPENATASQFVEALKKVPATAYAGFRAEKTRYYLTNFANGQVTHLVDGQAANTWISYGPTGSGANVTSADLSEIPVGASAVLVSLEYLLYPSGSNPKAEVWGDATGTESQEQQTLKLSFRGGPSPEQSTGAIIVEVPLDGSRRFSLRREQSNASSSIVMKFAGFVF